MHITHRMMQHTLISSGHLARHILVFYSLLCNLEERMFDNRTLQEVVIIMPV